MEVFKNWYINNFVLEEHLAYDESIVKYFGRHGCKQFIKGKPIQFGYKICSLNTKDNYFELYKEKNVKWNSRREKSWNIIFIWIIYFQAPHYFPFWDSMDIL